MHQLFDKENKQDSANKYFRLAAIAKDSVFSLQKSQNVQALAYREQLRQNELDTEKEKVARDRRDYIQYGILAIGIISFLLVVLLLSRSGNRQ